MAQYNIHLRSESHIANTWKVEKDDLAELRIEMARFVGEMLTNHAALIWADQDWQIDVSDATGLILYVINVSASGTAATMASNRSS